MGLVFFYDVELTPFTPLFAWYMVVVHVVSRSLILARTVKI